MRFLPFILKNLFRRKARSGLTVGGVGVAVGAVVALWGMSKGFEQSFAELYQHRGVDLVVVQGSKVDKAASLLPESLGEQIRALPGVKNVTSGLLDFINIPGSRRSGQAVQGLALDSFMFDDLRLLEGRHLQPGDRRVALIGQIAAWDLGKKVGDTVLLYDEPFQVMGVFESFSVFENGSVIVPVRELQELLGEPNRVTGFQVVAENPNDAAALDELRRRIDGLGKGVSAAPVLDYVQRTAQIRVAHSVSWVTSAIALVIGIIGILNTMFMSVLERTREIGILRAIGWRRGRVVRMILSESLLLSIAGAVLGTLGAVLLLRVLSTLPVASGLVEGNIAPSVLAAGFVLALVVGLMGGAYPAYRGARLLPTEALRHE